MWTDRKEIVIRFPEPKPLPFGVIYCPNCGGRGKNADGSCLVSTTEFRYTPASDCGLCDGTGRLETKPYHGE